MSSKGSAITFAEVARLLAYDPETGMLVWRASRGGIRAGQAAGSIKASTGYVSVGINGLVLYAHRIAWLLSHGNWPKHELDHINGIRHDNRLSNLREVTRAGNRLNIRRPSHNKSGILGVSWHPRDKAWSAHIRKDGRGYHLGSFKTVEEAIAARKAAEERLGFHANHGRAA